MSPELHGLALCTLEAGGFCLPGSLPRKRRDESLQAAVAMSSSSPQDQKAAVENSVLKHCVVSSSAVISSLWCQFCLSYFEGRRPQM